MSRKPRDKKVEQAQPEQPQGEQINNVVVTVVISPGKDGEANVSHSVLVNGKATEGTQVALVMAGKLALTVTAGAENTNQIRALAGGARNLADGLQDQVIGLLLAIAEKQVKADNTGKADEPPAPPVLPPAEADKQALTA